MEEASAIDGRGQAVTRQRGNSKTRRPKWSECRCRHTCSRTLRARCSLPPAARAPAQARTLRAAAARVTRQPHVKSFHFARAHSAAL
jgi:hypothetical protein